MFRKMRELHRIRTEHWRSQRGEFVGLLDHDDLLEENALYEIVSCPEQRSKDRCAIYRRR